ncbi:MAG: hypothetical protein R3F56_04445 [Planctomycetota bacterium]
MKLEAGDRLEFAIASTTEHRVEGRDHRGKAFDKDAGYGRRVQMHLGLEVQDKDAAGCWRVDGEVQRVLAEFPLSGAPVVSLDSADSENAAAVKSVLESAGVWGTAAEPLLAFVGEKFTFTLSPSGHVSELRGLSPGSDESARNKRDHASILLIGAPYNNSAWQAQLQSVLFGGVPADGSTAIGAEWTRTWTVRPFETLLRLAPETRASRGIAGGVFSSGGLATNAPVVAPPELWECCATYTVGKADARSVSTSFRSGSVVLPSKRSAREAEQRRAERERHKVWFDEQVGEAPNLDAQHWSLVGLPKSLQPSRFGLDYDLNPFGPPVGLGLPGYPLPGAGATSGSNGSAGGQIVWDYWNRGVDAMFPSLVATEISPVPGAQYRLHGNSQLSRVDGLPLESVSVTSMAMVDGRTLSIWNQRFRARRMSKVPARAISAIPASYYSLDRGQLLQGVRDQKVRDLIEATDAALAMRADGSFDLIVVSGSKDFGVDGLWVGEFHGSWDPNASQDTVQFSTERTKADPARRGTGDTWAPWIRRFDDEVKLFLRAHVVTKETEDMVVMEEPPGVFLQPCDQKAFEQVALRVSDPEAAREARRPRFLREFGPWYAWISDKASFLGIEAPSIDTNAIPKDSPAAQRLWAHARVLFRAHRGELSGDALFEVRKRLVEASRAIAAGREPVNDRR